MGDEHSVRSLEINLPSEIRHILFRPVEVVQAVTEFYKQTSRHLPPGNVVQGKTTGSENGHDVGFLIYFAANARAAQPDAPYEQLEISGARLVAALILYCRNRNIPLSARTDKLLQRFGDQVCLITIYNANPAEAPHPGQFTLQGARLVPQAAA